MTFLNSFRRLSETLSFDLFAFTPSLLFNGKTSHKSCLGVAATYFHLAITIFAFFLFGQELILRENPNVIISESRLELNTLNELNFNSPESLELAFGIFDTDQLIAYDRTIFNITGEKRSYYYKDTGFWEIVKTVFEIDSCSREYIVKEYGANKTEEEFKYLTSRSICLTNKTKSIESKNPDFLKNSEQESNLNIKGLFGSKNHSFLLVKIARCRNSSTFSSISNKKILKKNLLK